MSAAQRGAFYALHCLDPARDCCNCVAWWTPTWDDWGERTSADNGRLREELFDAGEYDGYLMYEGEEVVGWCQVGSRDRLEKLRAQYGLMPDPNVWAISCFLLRPAVRGRGAAHVLLGEVLKDLRARGVVRVEAFPRRGDGLPADDVWTGPEALFARAGFTVEQDHPEAPVYALDLDG